MQIILKYEGLLTGSIIRIQTNIGEHSNKTRNRDCNRDIKY